MIRALLNCLPFVWRRTSESAVILVIWLEKFLNDEDTKELADYLRACHELRKKLQKERTRP